MDLETTLKQLYSAPGPTVTAVLGTPSAVEDAPQQMDLRWKNARQDLEAAGVVAAELEALDQAVAEHGHGEGATLVVAKPSGGDTFIDFLDDPVVHDLAVVDALPRLGALLESHQRSVDHVMVVADRTGADIVAVVGGRRDDTIEVEGSTLHVHRGQPGGWSQRRFQQRAENQWERNAGEVAEAIVATTDEVGARVVAVAGDVRAVGFILDDLPDDLAEVVHKMEAQSDEEMADEVVRVVADLVARDSVAVLEAYDEAKGQGRAAVGTDETFEALSEGRVQTLLVHDDPEDDRRASFDPEGLWCAAITGEDAIEASPTASATEGRLVDVALRGAVLGDADVRIVPKHAVGGEAIGALLRW